MQQRLRLISGLILSAFVVTHFTNHTLGIISLENAEAFRASVHLIWGSGIGGIVLYGAFVTHFALALASLYRRRTLRLPRWELAQLILGLVFVPLIATHVIAMRGAEEVLDVTHEYARTVFWIWSDSAESTKQVLLILTTWLHTALGLHFWLRLKPWYRRTGHLWTALYTVVPMLTLIGFYRSGRAVELLSPEIVDASMNRLGIALNDYAEFVGATSMKMWLISGGLLLSTLCARLIRSRLREKRATFALQHSAGQRLRGTVGQTVLETLRTHGIAHASVCGGRGRCTTCRVRIGSGLEQLPPPSPLEESALARISAEPRVRLACQTRPSGALAITPLVAPATALTQSGQRGGVAGTELVITVLFVDLRGSTKLGQARLPYDVLFILNQFFSEMAASLQSTQGHYAQFNGDGLMAIYGRDGVVRDGARAALRGALEMLTRLEQLNSRLGEELGEPLKIGIGIHTGEAIVGTMGPPESPIFSAIGDNINLAARLESLTKELRCPLVVSQETATRAELDAAAYRHEVVAIRGRTGEFPVLAIERPTVLAAQLAH